MPSIDNGKNPLMDPLRTFVPSYEDFMEYAINEQQSIEDEINAVIVEVGNKTDSLGDSAKSCSE